MTESGKEAIRADDERVSRTTLKAPGKRIQERERVHGSIKAGLVQRGRYRKSEDAQVLAPVRTLVDGRVFPPAERAP